MKKLLSILLTLTMVMGALVVVPFTASAESLDDHLITHWDFAGENPLADKAINGNSKDNLTQSGDYGFSYAGGVAYFYRDEGGNIGSKLGGSYRALYCSDSADLLRTKEDRTIYIKFRVSSGIEAIDVVNQYDAIYLKKDKNGTKYSGSTTSADIGTNWWCMNYPFKDGEWTTIAVSYDKNNDNNSFKITTAFMTETQDWLSFTRNSEKDQTWDSDGDSNFYIGDTTSKSGKWGDLQIEDIRIYDKAMTVDEMKSISVTQETAIEESALLSHWDFAGDYPLNDKATVGSANQDNLEISTSDGVTIKDGTVTLKQGLDSNGLHRFLYVENSDDLLRTLKARTIFIRFKSSRDDEQLELLSQNDAVRMGYNLNSSGTYHFTTSPEYGSENKAETTNMTYSKDTWITIAVSYEKTNNGLIYINSHVKNGASAWVSQEITRYDTAQTFTGTDSSGSVYNAGVYDLYVGRLHGGNGMWHGDLTFDDIRIYDGVLSAAQIASIEITNPTPTPAGVENAGHSLSLAGDIGVNFYLTPNTTAMNAKVTIKNGETVLLENASFDAAHKFNDIDYKFTANVSAKEMADELTLTVMNGDTQLYTDTYSVREYGLTVISGTGYSTEVVELVKAMLLYGGCAQTYFAYNTSNGYLDGIGGLSTIAKDAKYNASISGSITGITVEAATLTLETKTQIVVALKAENGAYLTNYTFSGGTAIKQGDYIYITTDGICVQDLDVMQTITITSNTDNTQKIEISYAPMTFIQEMADNKGDTAIDTLVRAMYDCWVAAEAYVAANNA